MTSWTPEILRSDPAVSAAPPDAVTCRRVRHDLLHDVDLVLPSGWRLLVASRPGSAASTLLRIMAGLLRPRAGGVARAGTVAYVGPRVTPPRWMTPREVLGVAASLHGRTVGDRVADLLAAHGLEGAAERPLRRSPVHVAERTLLAAAMVGDPRLLVLDDPLASLDFERRARLLERAALGRTVVLTSPYPARERGIADHVALLRGGSLALLAPVAELDARGLPLSLGGIEALAARTAGVAAGEAAVLAG
jgi:ABC-type multidrug transport system ATPase subunit